MPAIRWRSKSYEQVARHFTAPSDNICERCGNDDEVKSMSVSLDESIKHYFHPHYPNVVKIMTLALTLQNNKNWK